MAAITNALEVVADAVLLADCSIAVDQRVCSRNDASVDVRRPQPATTDVGDDELTVIDEVRCQVS